MIDEQKERWPYCTRHGWVFLNENDYCTYCGEENAQEKGAKAV